MVDRRKVAHVEPRSGAVRYAPAVAARGDPVPVCNSRAKAKALRRVTARSSVERPHYGRRTRWTA